MSAEIASSPRQARKRQRDHDRFMEQMARAAKQRDEQRRAREEAERKLEHRQRRHYASHLSPRAHQQRRIVTPKWQTPVVEYSTSPDSALLAHHCKRCRQHWQSTAAQSHCPFCEGREPGPLTPYREYAVFDSWVDASPSAVPPHRRFLELREAFRYCADLICTRLLNLEPNAEDHHVARALKERRHEEALALYCLSRREKLLIYTDRGTVYPDPSARDEAQSVLSRDAARYHNHERLRLAECAEQISLEATARIAAAQRR